MLSLSIQSIISDVVDVFVHCAEKLRLEETMLDR
jgi:hypothetical protein